MMSVDIFGCVLPLTVYGLVGLLHDLRAFCLRMFEMRIDIIDEYRQTLGSSAELRRRRSPVTR